MTDSAAIISAGEPLSEPTATSQPSTGERLTTKETIKSITKTWKSSLFLKIISGVVVLVVILFIVFMSTTIAFSSEKGSCKSDLESEKSKVDSCQKKVDSLNGRVNELNEQLESEKKKTRTLESEVTQLKKKQEDLEKTIKDKDSEIASLNSKNKELTGKVASLETQVRNLQNEVQQKNSEIDHWKQEVHTRDEEIAKVKNQLKYFQWGAVGSGVVHVGVIIDDIAAHSSAGTQRRKAEELENKNRDLQGQINNANNKIKELDKENERLKEEVNHVNELRQHCQQDLAHERELYEECMRGQEKLRRQIDIIPKLALDQAQLQILMQETQKTMAYSLIYNSTLHGFHKEEFINRVKGCRPTVVIIRTTSGYVFGGSTNITWESSGGVQTDPAAFTFSSTNHHICKIKEPKRAVYFNDEYFIEFGDPEFWVEKTDNKVARGNAESDRVYNCGANDRQNFYNDGVELTVQELLVYEVKINDSEQPAQPIYDSLSFTIIARNQTLFTYLHQ
eukprot:TRINITY_DN708_c0_g1_i1.p3 TRINITY_DN708_c0_g1~~TRINITY_DN708_c0_g1_i1.p3  ORF type:complete len:507 (+),score=64.66 TRINITY_DN708_c0_g1_i1:8298-9818(+)